MTVTHVFYLHHHRHAQDLDLRVLVFNHFGKQIPKAHRISPDAFIQMAIQLAYYRWDTKGLKAWFFLFFFKERKSLVSINNGDLCSFNIALRWWFQHFICWVDHFFFLSWQDPPAVLCIIWSSLHAFVQERTVRCNPFNLQCLSCLCQVFWWSQKAGQIGRIRINVNMQPCNTVLRLMCQFC